ncbi:MAG: hypothetical protein ACRENN_11090 [Candidatus Eiseniibacteriota bacterium]
MRIITGIVTALILGMAPAAEAQYATPTANDGRWHYLIAPYFLAPNMEGKTGLAGVTTDVNASPGDIFDKLQFGAMAYLQAKKGPWAIGLDWTYMNLRQDGSTALGMSEVDMKQTGLTLAGFKQVTPRVEAMAGLQLTSVRAGLTTTGPLAIDRSGSWTWVDPVIGGRVNLYEAGKWRITFLGDIGGFGIASDFTWQAYPIVSFRVDQGLDLAFAYRAVGIDYETGSGSSKFIYDMVTFGPELGIGFHF